MVDLSERENGVLGKERGNLANTEYKAKKEEKKGGKMKRLKIQGLFFSIKIFNLQKFVCPTSLQVISLVQNESFKSYIF